MEAAQGLMSAAQWAEVSTILGIVSAAVAALGVYLRLTIAAALADFRKEMRAEYLDVRVAAVSMQSVQSEQTRQAQQLDHLATARERHARN
jgi:ABC-type lipoprotein release transport system permease subunit